MPEYGERGARRRGRRGLLAPGAAFLAKPFSPDALVREVQARLHAARTPSAPNETLTAPSG